MIRGNMKPNRFFCLSLILFLLLLFISCSFDSSSTSDTAGKDVEARFCKNSAQCNIDEECVSNVCVKRSQEDAESDTVSQDRTEMDVEIGDIINTDLECTDIITTDVIDITDFTDGGDSTVIDDVIEEDTIDISGDSSDVEDSGGDAGITDTIDASCVNECNSGERECVSSSSLKECVLNKDTGCYEWSSEIFCNSPPQNVCFNQDELRIYNSSGECQMGYCKYNSTTITCTNGCENGRCKDCTPDCNNKECGDDGCGGSCGSCTSVPSDYCLDSTTLRDYAEVGSCSNYKCIYPFVDKKCSPGDYCNNGLCRRPACVPDCDGKPYGSPDGCNGTCHNLLSGTFICISASCAGSPSNLSPATYYAMLKELRENSMYTVILHSLGAVTCSTGCIQSREVSDEELRWALDGAAERGVELYIGLMWCEEKAPSWYWWNDPVKSECINADLELVRHIESLFGDHPALRGYYIVQEAYVGGHDLTLIDDFYAPVISGIHTIAPKRAVIAGGYMCPYCAQNPQSPTEIMEWVKKFLWGGTNITGCGADIFLLQDGVGSFDTPLRGSPAVVDYLKAAQDGAVPTPLWADIELFQWSATKTLDPTDNWYHPANAIRINEQLYSATYTSTRRIAWIMQHHMSNFATASYRAEEAAHLLRGYQALYFKGTYYDNPTYTTTPSPSQTYPDSGGKLFDNVEGNRDWDTWVGWGQPAGSWVEINVDLGSVRPVSDVTAIVRTETNAAIFYPTALEVQTSSDGLIYNYFGSLSNPYTDRSVYSKAYLWVAHNPSVNARYIRIRLKHGGWWLFLSELEVYGQ